MYLLYDSKYDSGKKVLTLNTIQEKRKYDSKHEGKKGFLLSNFALNMNLEFNRYMTFTKN